MVTAERDYRTLDQAALTPLVRRALGREAVEVIDWAQRPIYGGFGGTTAGIYQVRGRAREGHDRGADVAWSLVLKIITPPANTLLAGTSDGAQHWRREALAYQSDLLAGLSGDFRAPRCFGVVPQQDGAIWLWLEDVADEAGPTWTLSRYGLAARHVGAFNAGHLMEPGQRFGAAGWLSRNWLRSWVEQFAGAVPLIPALRDDPALGHAWPADVAEGLLRLWAEREVFLTALERLPQSVCHMDVFRRNLPARRRPDGSDETVAVDWAFTGLGAIGEDLGPLVAASVAFFEVGLDEMPALDDLAFLSYLQGLRDAGWRGDARAVRFAYAAAAALRYGLIPIPLQVPNDAQRARIERSFGRSYEEFMAHCTGLRRCLLALADEARSLLPALS